ncbi:MAG: hypothetical protein NZM12_03875 [Steroidobacteraceae bacterium]|nr:hypothetical protein [Steroidobacteraceae bacterium]MDW8259303.1 hypothetical protein [Gammaproteobacteria bacterium]
MPASVEATGAPKYRDYRDVIVRYERPLVGEPNSDQWEAYLSHQ